MSRPTTLTVTHLATGEVFRRPDVLLNPHHGPTPQIQSPDPAVENFHKTLPHYSSTPLIALPDLARELGIAHAFVKDESLRFGLPSFKILGASWAVYLAICEKTNLARTVSLHEAGEAARAAGIKLVTCSAGNWGRAVARMGHYLGIEVKVFVFQGVSEATKAKISGEGAAVTTVDGTYDDSIEAAIRESEEQSALLVMDTSWAGFETIPQWVVEGYSTMLLETDRQLQEACGGKPSVCIVPVGVGSIAQAVVAHYTATDPGIRNVTVESEAAPCLLESLQNDEITPLRTGDTILPPLNCGTVSSLAWPILRSGVHAAVAVSDVECHRNLKYLKDNGICAGPCGAATLAAARKLHESKVIGHDRNAVLVLFSTEGARDYVVPDGV